MLDSDKAEFLAGYTRVLTKSWSSTEYAENLSNNPKQVLADAGLAVPVGATVSVIRDVGGDANLDAQIAKWDEGAITGLFTLYVPGTPMIDTAELSESDLEAVSAGDNTYCCCCCPCCSCT